MAALKEKAAEYEKKLGEMQSFLGKHKDDKGGWKAFTPETQKEFGDRNAELDALRGEVMQLKALADAEDRVASGLKDMDKPADNFRHPVDGARPVINFGKSLMRGFKDSGKDKDFKLDASDVDLKTLMTTSAGYAPEVIRNRPELLSAQRPIRLLDLIFSPPITQTGVKYMEETTFTNNAAEAAEGGTYGEAALAFTEQSSLVRKIAVYLPITDEQLEDVAYAEAYVNNRLGYMLRARLESQVVNGNGTAPNLRGLLNIAGIQTQAKSTDPVFDAILKGATKLKLDPYTYPNLGIIHPTDWQNIRLTADANGRYLLGDPGMPGDMRLFGIPFVESTVLTAGTAILQDTTTLELPVYRGVDVRVGMVNDDFIKGKQAIRADVRVAFFSYRPKATCTVTGL